VRVDLVSEVGGVPLVPDVVDELERPRYVDPHRVRLPRRVLELHEELVDLREGLTEWRDLLPAQVLEHPEHGLGEAAALDLLGAKVAEMEPALSLLVRLQ